ncbi:MAG: glycosyltransferase family 4 protein [Clostridia bacterium]|nr:glycosyltransferase family 4 protein [Clostridia bacterium]
MKVLLVNKFLYPKGGVETYVFKLGETLTRLGHTVQYFGLENEKNIVGNEVQSYVTDMDFAKGVMKNLKAPFRIIYSSEARKKIRRVLDDFQPDVVHLNNIQFHLTPSIILETEKYRRQTGRKVKIVYTAHDYQLVCPSHGLFDTQVRICEKCLGGNYTHCFKTKCVKNSRSKSLLAMLDAYKWKRSKAYDYVDAIICPSLFLKSKLDTQERLARRTVALHNFIEPQEPLQVEKGDYVLEFGHLSKDKGTLTLLEVAKRMPDVRFVFAGFGKAVDDIKLVPNAEYVGFKTGDELKRLIQGAACSVCPSECYENCPFAVIESQIFLTPVIGSRRGGIPELLAEGKTGLLFEAGNADDLEEKLRYLVESPERLREFTENCKNTEFETPESYCEKLMRIYGES